MTEQRRLAAILVADVVGYSKLMGSDEAGTLAQLDALRTEIIEPQIAKHAGRLFKSVGDGFFIEFASAVQAVSCAKAIQEANDLGHLPLRIGIHVGDVVVQGDDLMGDGVNVAARIEGIADPGGIAITRAVHEQVRDRLDLGFIDKGEIELKNIQRPVQIFVIGGARVDGQATALPLPDKPSIAVLPFQNMSGDPEQEHVVDATRQPSFARPRLSIVVLPFELLGGDPADGYLADGITEDLTSDLSHVPGTFVIARASAYSYRGKVTDVRRIGAELGVRYAVTGSVRRIGATLRVNAQLISTESGAQLWSDRFDQAISDLARGQERIVLRLRAALAVGLTDIEARRSARERPTNPDAFDLDPAGAGRAQPDRSRQIPLLRQCVFSNLHCNMIRTPSRPSPGRQLPWPKAPWFTTQRMRWIARRITWSARAGSSRTPSGSSDTRVFLLRVQERWSELPEAAERLIEAYPNSENGYNHLALVRIYQGRLEEAIPLLEASMRLSPRNPIIYFREWRMALVMVLLGRHEEAIAWAKRAANPGAPARWRATSLLIQAAASAQMGELLAARLAVREAQRLWPLDTVRTRYVEGPASLCAQGPICALPGGSAAGGPPRPCRSRMQTTVCRQTIASMATSLA